MVVGGVAYLYHDRADCVPGQSISLKFTGISLPDFIVCSLPLVQVNEIHTQSGSSCTDFTDRAVISLLLFTQSCNARC